MKKLLYLLTAFALAGNTAAAAAAEELANTAAVTSSAESSAVLSSAMPTLDSSSEAAPISESVSEFVVENGELIKYNGSGGEVLIPETVDGETITAIGRSTFENNQTITGVTAPESVTKIGKYAFADCTALVSVELRGAIEMDSFVFDNDTALESVSFGEGTKVIRSVTFSDCSSLKKLVLPMSLEEVNSANGWSQASKDFEVWSYAGSYAEYYFSTVMPRVFHSFNETASENGFTVSEDGILCSYGGSETDIVIPETAAGIKVRGIGTGTFIGNNSLSSVYIPDGVTQLNSGAFEDCTALKNVRLPSDLEILPRQIFKGCAAIESIELPENISDIGEGAFEGCVSLKGIELPPSLTEINKRLFYGCEKLGYAEIGNVSSIGAMTFDGCKAITEFCVPDTVVSLGSGCFSGCEGLTKITIPESVTSIGSSCFESCKSLEEIELNAKITDVTYQMFDGCVSLKEITLPDGTQKIYDNAFRGCTSLEKVFIPSSLVIAVSSSFDRCNKLSIYGESGSYIEKYAAENKLPFVSIGTAAPVPTKEPLPEPGDVQINSTDYKYGIISVNVIGTRNGVLAAAVYGNKGRFESVILVNDDRWIPTKDGSEICIKYDATYEYMMLFNEIGGEPLCQKKLHVSRIAVSCQPYHPQSTPPPWE